MDTQVRTCHVFISLLVLKWIMTKFVPHYITIHKFQKDPYIIFELFSFTARVHQSFLLLNNHFHFAIRFVIKKATLAACARIKVTRSHMHMNLTRSIFCLARRQIYRHLFHVFNAVMIFDTLSYIYFCYYFIY